MKKIVWILIIIIFITGCSAEAIRPKEYAVLLGKGINVDWAKTVKGIENYNEKAVIDFKRIGFSHVRIRVKEKLDETLLIHLEKVVDDCLKHKLIPVVAYQASYFKKEPNEENLNKVVAWWSKLADRFKDKSYLLSYDMIIEVTEALNRKPNILNELYEKVVASIRITNPRRIIFISPVVRSYPEYLKDLKIPDKHNGYLMAEWHFYAAGPYKDNPKRKWTIGTEQEKNLIIRKLDIAMKWQNEQGIYTWVGAWMPGNYNHGNDYSVDEQIVFAEFVTGELDKRNIPFAINADTKFYNRETNTWIEDMMPVLKTILNP